MSQSQSCIIKLRLTESVLFSLIQSLIKPRFSEIVGLLEAVVVKPHQNCRLEMKGESKCLRRLYRGCDVKTFSAEFRILFSTSTLTLAALIYVGRSRVTIIYGHDSFLCCGATQGILYDVGNHSCRLFEATIFPFVQLKAQ